MSKRTPAGPAAYHTRLEVEKIAALEARVLELSARLAGWVGPAESKLKVDEAIRRTYQAAHQDGYNAGWGDAQLGVVCHQYGLPRR